MKKYTSCILFLLFGLCQSAIFDVDISGTFSNCQPPGDRESKCTFSLTNTSEHQVRWGKSYHERSGLGYLGFPVNFTLEVLEEPQLLGRLRHYNWPVTGEIPDFVDLSLSMGNTSFDFTLSIDETLNKVSPKINGSCPYPVGNNSLCCPYFSPKIPCSDRIGFLKPVNANQTIVLNGSRFTLSIDGFFSNGTLINEFITQEEEISDGYLYGRMVRTCNGSCPSSDPCVKGKCFNGVCEYTLLSDCSCFSSCDTCLIAGCLWCDSSCQNSTCSNPSKCSSGDQKTPVYAIIAGVLACCCLLALLALLGIFALLMAIPLIKVKLIPYIQGVSSAKDVLQNVDQNPLYENKFTSGTNPIFSEL